MCRCSVFTGFYKRELVSGEQVPEVCLLYREHNGYNPAPIYFEFNYNYGVLMGIQIKRKKPSSRQRNVVVGCFEEDFMRFFC